MSFSFGMITPHPPLIIERIGKENTAKLNKTQKAFEALEKYLSLNPIDTLIVISPHNKERGKFFDINFHHNYYADFSDFGDFTDNSEYKGNIRLVHLIQKISDEETPVRMTHAENLDYGVSIPLELLLKKIKNISIVPLYTSDHSLADHFELGKKLYEVIQHTNQKIGIIASADLSHKLTSDAPGGYSKKATKFDQTIKKNIAEQNYNALLELTPEELEDVGECGIKPIMILAGIVSNMSHKTHVLCYEKPFGIGYMTVFYQ